MIRFRNGLIKFLIPVLAGVFFMSTAAGIPVPQSKKAAPSPTPVATPKPPAAEQAGQETRVVGAADAAGTISLLYHVHDRLESFFDSATFCSRGISRNTEEGFRRVNTNITFDYQRGKSMFDQKNLKKQETKHEEHDIPNCVTDLLSGVYYVASLPLLQGKTYSFPLSDGGQTLTVNVHVEAREQIKTPAGTFNTVRVQPETASGLLKDKGKIWIWYSDDAARVPVQMRARMSWGTLTFVLQRIEHK